MSIVNDRITSESYDFFTKWRVPQKSHFVKNSITIESSLKDRNYSQKSYSFDHDSLRNIIYLRRSRKNFNSIGSAVSEKFSSPTMKTAFREKRI